MAAERLSAFHGELVDELEMNLFSALEGRHAPLPRPCQH